MRIIFMGTPDYAVPYLEMLCAQNYEIIGVVTKPDRPKGRDYKLCASPVKEFALKKNLKILQPEKINTKESLTELQNLAPDLIVVVGFGQILGETLLSLPKYGCVNVHYSLLPKYRGGAPVQWTLINGEDKTGVTTMFMEKKLDTGQIILQKELVIDLKDNTVTLIDKLTKIGVELLKETLSLIKNGQVKPTKQEDTQATLAPMLHKEDGLIDWKKSSHVIHNFIRGMMPWPGAFTTYGYNRDKPKILKIWEAEEVPKIEINHKNGLPGQIIDIVKNRGFFVKCGEGGVLVNKVQAESGKMMPAFNFVIGHHLKKRDVLGK